MTREGYLFAGLHEDRLVDIANEFGTPLIVYSEAVLRRSASDLSASLPQSAELAYSIKANPSPYILRVFRDLGLLAEAASIGEFRHALEHGFPASRMLLGGPGISDPSFLSAKEFGPQAILLESENAIARAAELELRNVPVLLRVNPVNLKSEAQTRMTGMASPFGIDEGRIPGAVEMTERLGLDYAGLSMYVGTQVAGAKAIASNTRHLLQLDGRLEEAGFSPARILDFGGGFPVPESPEQSPLDLSALRTEMSRMDELHDRNTDTRLLFESGRYLVNEAGILLTRVLDTKTSLGKRFAILDTGINSFGLRQLRYRTHTPLVQALATTGPLQPTTLVGPTCTPIDLVAEDALIPPVEPGSIVCVPQFGAYSVCFSPNAFCGHGYPAEVSVSSDGEVCLGRRHPTRPVGDFRA